MNYCKDCNTKMIGVMSFRKNKHEKFCRCPRCYSETKHRKIDDKELNFEEVLDKEMRKTQINT